MPMVTSGALERLIEADEPEQRRLAPWIGGGGVDIVAAARDLRDAGVLGLERGVQRVAARAALAIAGHREQLLVAGDAGVHGLAQLVVVEWLVEEPEDLAL